MDRHPVLSSYLVRPNLRRSKSRRWRGFRTRLLIIHRHNPQWAPRLMVLMSVWGMSVSAFGYYAQASHANSAESVAAAASPPAIVQTASIQTTTATPTAAAELPSGPSGLLLPPGALAAPGTYANTYTRGQCTWYAASRRQIPNTWRNARNWYYNAMSSGWRVGTIPAIGAIAWTSAGSLGHVAVVEQISGNQIYIGEMNYNGGAGREHHRWVSASSFKYIY